MSADDLYRTCRLVLKRRHWIGAGEFAEEHGWAAGPVEDNGAGRMSWSWYVDETTVFRVTRDPASGEFYCRFHGPDRAALGDLLAAAEERLDVWDTADLLDAPFEETDPKLLVQAVFRLGLGAPMVHTHEFMPPLLHAMAQEHPMLRAAAVRSTAYTEWPEFVPILEAMADNDPDERVRAEAAKVVGVYRQAGI